MKERGPEFPRRRLLQAAGLTAVVAAAGFGTARYQHPLRESLGFEAPAVDVHKLPEVLPSSVDSVQYGVVDISWQDGNKLSGVIINDHQLITAGHGFFDDNNQLLPYASCEGEVLIAGLNEEGAVVQTRAKRLVSSFDPHNPSVPDITLIELETPLALRTVQLAETQPSPGDPLILLNRQSDSQGRNRNPSSESENHKFAAIYGGIYTGDEEGDFLVRTGLKNYGRVPDTKSRKGASGGAVATLDGFLVGISNAITFDGLVTHVEPVTSNLLARLSERLKTNPDACIRS